MKIRPAETEIPKDEPFKHDLLDREKTILTLAQTIDISPHILLD